MYARVLRFVLLKGDNLRIEVIFTKKEDENHGMLLKDSSVYFQFLYIVSGLILRNHQRLTYNCDVFDFFSKFFRYKGLKINEESEFLAFLYIIRCLRNTLKKENKKK